MAVKSHREVLPRTFSHKFGESPTAERKFIATVDGPTNAQEVINSLSILHTSTHPEFSYLRMTDATLSELDSYHVEITYKYDLPKQKDLDPNPLARPDVWSFSTGGAQIPALTYYHGAGNNDIRPLQNTAKEYIEGLSATEAEVRASISGNRTAFPLAAARDVTNAINSTDYLGCEKHTWQCAGISGQQEAEVVNGMELRFWSITVELVYRRSGWNLLIPNVGWNYLLAGRLERCWVWFNDPEEGLKRIPSTNPRALNENGSLRAEGLAPDILPANNPAQPGDKKGLRVFPEVDFTAFFGTPPWDVL